MSRSAFADEFVKLSTGSPFLEAVKHIGAGALGFGAGTAAGLGLAELASRTYGGPVPRRLLLTAAPVLATGAGIAYSLHKSREAEALRRVVENHAEPRGR